MRHFQLNYNFATASLCSAVYTSWTHPATCTSPVLTIVPVSYGTIRILLVAALINTARREVKIVTNKQGEHFHVSER